MVVVMKQDTVEDTVAAVLMAVLMVVVLVGEVDDYPCLLPAIADTCRSGHENGRTGSGYEDE